MTRAFILFLKIGLLVAAAIWLSQYPGRVSVDWQGWRLDLSLGLMALCVLIFVIAVVLLARFWSTIVSVPGRFMGARRAARRERGYRALTQGLVAVAAGDTAEAHKQARKAETLLNDPPLTRLLAAQAAQLEGDSQAAKRYFEQMLDNPETAFLGLRGLLGQAINRGDRAEALRLVQMAREKRPGTPWVVEHLLALQEQDGDIAGALQTVNEGLRHKALPPEEGKAKKASLLVTQARKTLADGDKSTALKLGQEAVKIAPDAVEATVFTARLLNDEGKNSKAKKMLEEAWKRGPDPAIARAYRDIAPPSVDALGQVKRFEHLLTLAPDHPESHLALAEAALKAQLWGEARNHLKRFVDDDHPDPRVCRLMAELEEAEHGDLEKARHWLSLATDV